MTIISYMLKYTTRNSQLLHVFPFNSLFFINWETFFVSYALPSIYMRRLTGFDNGWAYIRCQHILQQRRCVDKIPWTNSQCLLHQNWCISFCHHYDLGRVEIGIAATNVLRTIAPIKCAHGFVILCFVEEAVSDFEFVVLNDNWFLSLEVWKQIPPLLCFYLFIHINIDASFRIILLLSQSV